MFEDVSGFVRRICRTTRGTFYECPGSLELYSDASRTLNRLCPEDKYQYVACYTPHFTPLMFNNTVVAVCGHYICDHDFLSSGSITVYREDVYTSSWWCNNREDCRSGVDEKYCSEEEDGEGEERFQCGGLDAAGVSELSTSRVCDKKCDCYHCDDEWSCHGYIGNYWYMCSYSSNIIVINFIPSYNICNNYTDCYQGDDESNCGNVTACAIEGSNTLIYILANYSRCTPWAWCANKLDQTNCSDTTLAPLQCPVGGYISTVSQHIICRSIIYTSYSRLHSNTSAVCDDNMDMQCVTPISGCYIHKHQLCDNITDCEGGSDEESVLCSRVTSEICKRKHKYNKLLKLPRGWINDGIEDCVGGIDEDITNWNSCNYLTFTIYGSELCEDVYICPSGYPPYVEIPSLCDEMLSCEGGNGICETAALASPQVRYTPAKVENMNYLHYCLLGLQYLKIYFAGCEKVNYPRVDILGTQPNYLFLPVKQVNCDYMYGEQYVYLSCSGKCQNTKCPLTATPLSGSTCSNILKRRSYSISSSGNLVIVEKHSMGFKVKNVFVCGNGNCVPYSKVCNLINDCGDGTDEDSCDNHFVCNVKSNFSKSYIPLTNICDGQYDCLDSSDEKDCCHRKLINDLALKMSAWLIGTLALLLNGIIQVGSLRTMRFARTSSALTDKVLITLISFGDWLVGCYLFVLAVTDAYYGSSFCSQQMHWLISSYCTILGVFSTFGSQISLFSMTILSVTRVFRISKGLSIPGPVCKKSYILVSLIGFFTAGVSITIAVIPLLPHFEDTFVNALFFPNINFLRGFVTKKSLKPTMESYYGRIMLVVSNLSWSSVRSLIYGMFTKVYGGVPHRILGFYGNDPVCLFKFFVSPDEPQSAYSWSLLATNFVCFGTISISYLIVFVITSTSSLSRSEGLTGDKVRSRNNRLQRKISIIILTDFLCWVPFVIICFLHTIGQIDASPWYALLSILILPINSVINPLLYDNTVGRIIGRVFRLIKREVDTIEITDSLRIFKSYRETRAPTDPREPGQAPAGLPDVSREPGHKPPVLPDVAREPGHTPPVLRDVAKEPEHTPPLLPDVAKEPGHKPLVLPDVAGEPGHTPPVLPDVAREPGHTPPVLPDVAREPGHKPPELPDVAIEPGHTPPVLRDVAKEPEHTPPVLPDVAKEPGHTPLVLPDVAKEPRHTPFVLPDVAKEPEHTPPVLPDVDKEPGHTPLVLPDVAGEPGHTPPVLPDDVREPGHIPLILPDVARKPGHTPPVLPDLAIESGHTPPVLPDVAIESGHKPPVLPDDAREPGHTPLILPDVARKPGHTPPVLPDVAIEPGHTLPVQPDVAREAGHTPPVLPDDAREAGHTPPVLPDDAREAGHTPPVLPDVAREPGHSTAILLNVAREQGYIPAILLNVAREPGNIPPVLPDIAREQGHSTAILLHVAREPGYIPAILLNVAREPGNIPPVLPDIAREQGHSTAILLHVAREPGYIPAILLNVARESGYIPAILSDVAREPGHLTPILLNVAREPGNTPPVVPDVVREPGNIPSVLPDVVREPGHSSPILPDVAREPGHTPPVLPDVAREPGHTPPVLHDVAREPGHTPPVLPDVAREPGHTPPVLPGVARELGHIPPVLPDIVEKPGHSSPILLDVARESGHIPPVLPDVVREPGHTPPVLPDVARELGHIPPVLPDIVEKPGHSSPILFNVAREFGHIPPVLPDIVRKPGHSSPIILDVPREPGYTPPILLDVAREPGHIPPVLPDIVRKPGY